MKTRVLLFAPSRGFTLIELLVVFTLLALLLSIAVPRYLQATESAKERVRGQNLATLRDAIDKFTADQGKPPQALDDLVAKQYLRRIPKDPVSDSDLWQPVFGQGGAATGVVDVEPPQLPVIAMPSPTQDTGLSAIQLPFEGNATSTSSVPKP